MGFYIVWGFFGVIISGFWAEKRSKTLKNAQKRRETLKNTQKHQKTLQNVTKPKIDHNTKF